MSGVVVLGAGFGGLELAARLSAASVPVTLIDRSDTFAFGFSKLDVLFGRAARDDVLLSYRDVTHPGVDVRREEIVAIDPGARRVVTDQGTYDADVLVVALGADYAPEATPGFVDDGWEFYSMAGAERLRDRLATFDGGAVVVAVLSVPFKCPPAPYEMALLLHEQLVARGVRDATTIEVVTPMASPIPVSPESSAAIVRALAERDIRYTPNHRVRGLDPARHVAILKEDERPYDLFVGIPVHRVPTVVEESGLTKDGADGWIHVDPRTLATPYDGVYALGDNADAPVPRAGVFAQNAAVTVAEQILARLRGDPAAPFDGIGACYLEFGDGTVGKVDANFLGGPSPVGPFTGPSPELAAEKEAWAAECRRRWFPGRG